MKRSVLWFLCAAAVLVLFGGCALADGLGEWHQSEAYGFIQLASYAGEYDGYVDVDGMGDGSQEALLTLRVISKNASVWSEPRTNSKKLGSASHGEKLVCRDAASEDEIWMENGFYAVDYKGNSGWVNADYVVRNTLEIVLMESNVPAYIAPDINSKKVGSLSKYTRYPVIGIYDNFYIINLRGAAAAYIPMDVRHYDTNFEVLQQRTPTYEGVTTAKTNLRTGPGQDYASVKELKTGFSFMAIDRIDGWYLIQYSDSNTDGEVFAYLDANDAAVSVPMFHAK